MPRRLRITTAGLIRHVTSRGDGRKDIFIDDDDRRRFLHLLGEMVERYDIECWQYCLMSNHYHLLLYPRRPNFSEGIRYLNGTFGGWWNERRERSGHVFQGRFKDQIVQEEQYLRNVCRYISMNPIRAGLVTHPSEWEWSSHRAVVGISREPAFLTTDVVLAQFPHADGVTAREAYASFVEAPHDDFATFLDCIRSNDRCLGDRAFKEHLGIIRRREEISDEAARQVGKTLVEPLSKTLRMA